MALPHNLVADFANNFKRTTMGRVAKSVLNTTLIDNVASDPDMKVQRNFKFHLTPYELPMTNQQNSGRCWIFSFTNVLRRKLMQRYHLPATFMLSQKYLMFYDHLEKCNALMELMYYMIHKKNVSINSLEFNSIRPLYLSDGGTWDYFVKLVEKYGLVPYEEFPDNKQAQKSASFRDFLTQQCYAQATIIASTSSRREFLKMKESVLQNCYNILESFLGTPPQTFKWSFVNSAGKFIEHKKPYTPMSFYKIAVKPIIQLDKHVVLINDPRNPYYRIYSVELMHNVLPANCSEDLSKLATNIYFNVPIDVMKKALYKSIKANMGVPFAADVHHYMRPKDSRLDTNVYYEDLLGMSFLHPKKYLYDNMMSAPQHAMLFIGTNGVNGEWQVENSWGVINEQFPYLTMTDGFFDYYVGEIIVHEKFLPRALREKYHKLKKDPSKYVFYEFWDVFGALTKRQGGSKPKSKIIKP